MEPTISIPEDWEYPRFNLGQRTKQGLIIGLQYNPDDTLLAHEYGNSWRYTVLPDKNSEEVRYCFDDELQALCPEELQAQLQTEIEQYQRQIAVLQQQIGTTGEG